MTKFVFQKKSDLEIMLEKIRLITGVTPQFSQSDPSTGEVTLLIDSELAKAEEDAIIKVLAEQNFSLKKKDSWKLDKAKDEVDLKT
jgi:hypothetical protein